MKKVSITAVRSDGLEFNYESEDWGLLEIAGLDFPEIEVFREPRGLGNGDIITGKRKHSRDIKLVARLRNGRNYEALRPAIIGFHNSNYTYELKITYLNETRIAKDCEITFVSYPTRNIMKRPMLTIEYLSPHADLFSSKSNNTSFSSTKQLWHDTRVYVPDEKLPFGEVVNTTSKVIEYLGSEPVPVKITVKATGYVPGIDVQLNDKTTSVRETMVKGDVVIIDTETRTVKKNEVYLPMNKYNVWDLYDLKLTYGDNYIKVSKDDNTAFTTEISYTGRYGGL